MQIFRIMSQFLRARARPINNRSRMFAMIRMPLATASLLAIAISLAGCGEGKDKAAAPQAPTPAASTTAPAAATPAGQVDEAAAKAVVAHYADMVFAVYSDAESTAKTLQ
ncbi:hypothetical protein AO284_04455, partial [Pseudomonas sp. NZIPFR-PS2]